MLRRNVQQFATALVITVTEVPVTQGMVVRYRNKAIKIAENVAGGEFPGKY